MFNLAVMIVDEDSGIQMDSRLPGMPVDEVERLILLKKSDRAVIHHPVVVYRAQPND